MVKRTNVLFIRLTEDEKRKLTEYAHQYNSSLNSVIVNFINNLVKEDKQND